MDEPVTDLNQISELEGAAFHAAVDSLRLDALIEGWDELSTADAMRIFIALDPDRKVDLLTALPIADQEEIVYRLSDRHSEALFAEMEPDDLADILQSVSPDVRKSVWDSLSEEAKRESLFLLRFDEDDAAGIMTPRYLAVNGSISVSQAMSFIRRRAKEVETVYYVYVVDATRRLIGVISLRDLLSAEDTAKIRDVMITNLVTLREETDQEEAARILETYGLIALPVVDGEGRLLGIVTFDDIIDVIREEQTEDVYKMGAMDGRIDPYLDESVLRLVRKRIPWLTILLLFGTITTNVLHHYESIIIGATFLFIFMPVITQTGGNAGSQSSTLMIRGLATGEIRFRDFFRIMGKEIMVGLIMGIATGAVIILRSTLLPPGIAVDQALAIGLSLSFVVLFSTLVGTIAPLVIHRLGFDPTVMSAPLMATLIDVTGLTIYFETSKLLLSV